YEVNLFALFFFPHREIIAVKIFSSDRIKESWSQRDMLSLVEVYLCSIFLSYCGGISLVIIRRRKCRHMIAFILTATKDRHIMIVVCVFCCLFHSVHSHC
uniref:Uncharacterized protein n=1 Tax=Parascaris univalens TaxID=6257 RepID=A0A915CEY8_PARUN